MRDEAGSINWNEIVAGNKVQSDWSRLKLFFLKMRNKFILFKSSKIKQNKWITRAVINVGEQKIRLGSSLKWFGSDPAAFAKI